MPRLLLVDDNPSIHKIAETLLGTTSIELVCVESGDEALRRVQAGEHFDVALVDTAMIGMDGWTLLQRLRALPQTARIPIAMMAGVLDSVDPGRLESAPIQGFLKKPVELRDLASRIEQLLATPVALSAEDAAAGTSTLDLALPADDLLLLEAEDLWASEAPAPAAAEPVPAILPEAEIPLELEELDLDSLRDIQADAHPAPAVPAILEPLEPLPAAPSGTPVPPVPLDEMEALEGLEPFEADIHVTTSEGAHPWSQEAWEKTPPVPIPSPEEEPFLVTADELPDLGDLVAAAEAPTVTLDAGTPPQPASHLEPELDLSLEEELDLQPLPELPAPQLPAAAIGAGVAGLGLGAGAAAFALAPRHGEEAHPAAAEPAHPAAATAPAATAAPSPSSAGATVHGDAHLLVQALLDDPAALDALAKALAGRLGEKALRDLAWEVMPELADRLKK